MSPGMPPPPRSTLPSARTSTQRGCELTPNCLHRSPVSSGICGISSRPYDDTKPLNASSESPPGMPTRRRLSRCSAFSSATAGASRRQLGHHGAQNHTRTSLPAAAARSNCCPSSCWVLSSRTSGRVSAGAAPAAVVAGVAAAVWLASSSEPPAESSPGSALAVTAAVAVGAAAAAGASSFGVMSAESSLAPQPLRAPARSPTVAMEPTSAVRARCRRTVTAEMLLRSQRGPRRDGGYIRRREHTGVDRNGLGHRTRDSRRVRSTSDGGILKRSTDASALRTPMSRGGRTIRLSGVTLDAR